MKRRNADCGKPRRPLKRGKITDGIYGSVFMYLKFLLVWALILLADFILDFRFEYLWPFWLMLKSVFDSFKFQGLAFSIFFVCITITSDVACYLFIPVQWLMFTASTYVWVQYVWQTERGVCLPSILLWLLFLYIEVGVRLRDLKSFPFHLDLCRPFAAHCVGYPVITLGFSFKSCISYRFRLRKQADVRRENHFHMQLLQDALPLSELLPANDKPKALPSQSSEEVVANGNVAQNNTVLLTSRKPSSSAASTQEGGASVSRDTRKSSRSTKDTEDVEFLEQLLYRHDACRDNDSGSDDNDLDGSDAVKPDNNHIGIIKNTVKSNNQKQATAQASAAVASAQPSTTASTQPLTGTKKNKALNNAGSSATTGRDMLASKLESDIRRLQSDLQLSRNTEQDLRSQINNLSSAERATKAELQQLRQDNERLQSKLHQLVTSRQQDKQNLATLEKKLQEEKKQRTAVEQQLNTEKRRSKTEEAASTNRANSSVNSPRTECSLDICKTRRWELENELKQIRRDLKKKKVPTATLR